MYFLYVKFFDLGVKKVKFTKRRNWVIPTITKRRNWAIPTFSDRRGITKRRNWVIPTLG